jgi:2-succinyl-5-enolpyruvyl-6-hydroxy-3-cyclohexene-1-carboxylate synthase
MYTDDQNAQIVLALFKSYGIKKIVVSPGTTNVPISRSVQVDPWFEVYSVVDERSAAYFAGGLAYESGEPVVISCTGATASRNYLPGLTEAYYRNLPVIALTSQHHTSDFGNLVPQITDRTVSQNDVKKIAVHLPVVKDEEDRERCILSVNKALISMTAHGSGPIHINLPVSSLTFNTKDLPDVRKIDYISSESIQGSVNKLDKEIEGKKIAIFVGAHRKFSKSEEKNLENFAVKYGAAVIIDQTSSYKGKNAILLAQISDLKRTSNNPDLVIDIGSITGEYSVVWLNGIETWRISEDGEIHDRLHAQRKLFDCSEEMFFSAFNGIRVSKNKTNYYKELAGEVKEIAIPNLPLSNTMISYELAKRLPKNSNLHLGILNSLRNMNFFYLDKTIDSSSNVGGFGIDGALSTLIGQSMVDKNKLTFGLVGDLAAFYDMNALGIRHISNNVRILFVNNNGGVEFRLNTTLEEQWAEATNDFISAHGHNGSMQAWAESMNFHYMKANSKDNLLNMLDGFCLPNLDAFDKPVLFEVFTEIADEQRGWHSLREENNPPELTAPNTEVPAQPQSTKKARLKFRLRKITPKPVKKLYRGLRRK